MSKYPSPLDYQGGYCLGGCGVKVVTRSGICIKCRTKDCRECGTAFYWKEIERNVCAKCNHARNKASRRNALTIYGSI